MRLLIITALLSATLLTACVVPGRHGPVVIAPPLPPVVELGDDPYYSYGGYHYYYHDNGWYYSQSRRGTWQPLPRDRYPREWRYRGERREWRERGDWDHGHDRGRGGWERR